MLVKVGSGRLVLVLLENVSTKVEYHVCHDGLVVVVVLGMLLLVVGVALPWVGKVLKEKEDQVWREDSVV